MGMPPSNVEHHWSNGEADEEEALLGVPVLRPSKKDAGIPLWLLIDGHGRSQVVATHEIMRMTDLSGTDFHLLDRSLFNPAAILGRDRAIVILLEHIRALITADKVLLRNARDPAVASFAAELQRRLRAGHVATSQQLAGGEQFLERRASDASPSQEVDFVEQTFEFQALEVCLDSTCRRLDYEARKLEDELQPLLEKITSVPDVNTHNLNRLLRIKVAISRVSARLQKVQGQVERLLNDDGDMEQMYLSEKVTEDPGSPSLSGIYDPHFESTEKGDLAGDGEVHRGSGRRVRNVEQLEMLLECYLRQIYATLNRLHSLSETVSDTKNFMRILLDDRQNWLLETQVLLAAGLLPFSVFLVVTGVFGMNFDLKIFEPETPDSYFYGVVGSCMLGSVVIFAICMAFFQRVNGSLRL